VLMSKVGAKIILFSGFAKICTNFFCRIEEVEVVYCWMTGEY
jgi:hypothetical protein